MKTIYVRKVWERVIHGNQVNWRMIVPGFAFMTAMYLLGSIAGASYAQTRESENVFWADNTESRETNGSNVFINGGAELETEKVLETGWHRMNKTENWGLGFGKKGEKPTGTATVDEMKKYDAYYMKASEDKVLYLTFDCGYENGNTQPILDALKKHQVKATFFVVGHFLETAPELVKRMVDEGHTLGNHTYHHPDMSKITEKQAFLNEMDCVRDKYTEITGEEMPMYYRPPQGKYSVENLEMAKELGYSTFFWSLAYVDWNVDQQPGHEEAMKKLTDRVHPGAIVLLHNTSRTNGEILDELLTKWEEMGYTFGTLDQFIEKEESKTEQGTGGK